jgi:hypothetical protein
MKVFMLDMVVHHSYMGGREMGGSQFKTSPGKEVSEIPS